jgi:putative transposase
MVKVPMALEAVGPNPTDRRKGGNKRHILVDGRGAPLSLVVTGANRHDVSLLKKVLDNRIASPPEQTEQNLCADKAYTGKPAKQIIESHGYIPHIKERGEEIAGMKDVPGFIDLAGGSSSRPFVFRELVVRF